MSRRNLNEIKKLQEGKIKPVSPPQTKPILISNKSPEILLRERIKEIKEETRETIFFKELIKRKFQDIKNYIRVEDVYVSLSSNLLRLKEELPRRDKNDSTFFSMVLSAWIAYENNDFPVYVIDKQLIQAFLETDLPDSICHTNRVFTNALFLFPDVIKTPDDKYIKWAFVSHLEKEEPIYPQKFIDFFLDIFKDYSSFYNSFKEAFKESSAEPRVGQRIRWVSSVADRFIYNSAFDLPEDSNVPLAGDLKVNYYFENDVIPSNRNFSLEHKFSRAIDNLILQIILYLQQSRYEDKDIDIEQNKISTGLRINNEKKENRSKTKTNLLYPKWVGKDFGLETEQTKRNYSNYTIDYPNKRSSPRPHERKGHWRTYKKETREPIMIWIKPMKIRKDKKY